MNGLAMHRPTHHLPRRGNSSSLLLLLAAVAVIQAISFRNAFVASGNFPWVTAQLVACRRLPTVAARASAAELELAQELTGTVSKINQYGAELDLGLDKIGWLSIGHIREERVTEVTDVLEVGQQVSVRVKDISRGSVEVTMRDLPKFRKKSLSLFNVGDELKGKVTRFLRKVVFVEVGAMCEGYLSIENMSGEGVILDPKDLSASSIKVGDELDVQVLKVTKNQLTLTQKGI